MAYRYQDPYLRDLARHLETCPTVTPAFRQRMLLALRALDQELARVRLLPTVSPMAKGKSA